MNITPKRNNSHYGMYYSPFRSETAPSFKVDFRKNLWYDFGSGEGGTMVDLVMKINNCTFREAMKKLQETKRHHTLLPRSRIAYHTKPYSRKFDHLKASH
jgi:DNA primase